MVALADIPATHLLDADEQENTQDSSVKLISTPILAVSNRFYNAVVTVQIRDALTGDLLEQQGGGEHHRSSVHSCVFSIVCIALVLICFQIRDQDAGDTPRSSWGSAKHVRHHACPWSLPTHPRRQRWALPSPALSISQGRAISGQQEGSLRLTYTAFGTHTRLVSDLRCYEHECCWRCCC
jgi:hypothetical protein